jgi:hypothetical protein
MRKAISAGDICLKRLRYQLTLTIGPLFIFESTYLRAVLGVFPQRPSPTDPDFEAADIILRVRRVFGRDGDPIQIRLTPPRLMIGI